MQFVYVAYVCTTLLADRGNVRVFQAAVRSWFSISWRVLRSFVSSSAYKKYRNLSYALRMACLDSGLATECFEEYLDPELWDVSRLHSYRRSYRSFYFWVREDRPSLQAALEHPVVPVAFRCTPCYQRHKSSSIESSLCVISVDGSGPRICSCCKYRRDACDVKVRSPCPSRLLSCYFSIPIHIPAPPWSRGRLHACPAVPNSLFRPRCRMGLGITCPSGTSLNCRSLRHKQASLPGLRRTHKSC